MEKRRLGNSELHISVLGLGCWPFGGGEESYWGAQSQTDVDKVVHSALDAGLNFFDTAEMYNDGNSEISLGIALRGRREEAVIGSKISPAHMRPERIAASCEASLKRLQTDYIDLYMVHWPIRDGIQEAYEALDRLRQEGKIRCIGISNHGVGQMQEALSTGVEIAANELAYNLFSRAIEREILPYCASRHIGVIGYMPLQQGLLTGKYDSLGDIHPNLTRSRHFHHRRGAGARHGEEGAEAEIEQALRELKLAAQESNVSLGELALAWTIANPNITSVIVGTRNLNQLESNTRGATRKLDRRTVDRLNAITDPVLAKLGGNPDYYENRASSRIS